MSASTNPYAPPAAHVADIIPASSDAEAVRLEHIKHETSVRSIGLLYYISGALLLFMAAGLLIGGIQGHGANASVKAYLLTAFLVVLGVLWLALARGIRALQPWARKVCIGLSLLGLLAFPVGTLINGYILYLLHAEQGKRIFKDDYLDIVAATPDIKYRTSPVVWIVLGVLILAVVAAILIPMLNR